MNIFLQCICGLIASFFALLTVEWLLPIRKNRWAKPLLYLGCSLLVGMIIYVGDLGNLPGTLLAFGLSVFFCCEGTKLQRLSITLILSSLGLSFNALVDSYFAFAGTYYLCRFLLWMLLYLAIKHFAPKQEYNLPSRLWILVDVLTLTPFAVTLITVLLRNPNVQDLDIQDISLLPVVTLSSFGLLWVVVELARQQKLEREKNLYKLNHMYYQNLEQEQFQVRRLRHDMANHLQVMSSLPEYELRDYLAKLINSPAIEHSRRLCENNVVNAVLTAKQLRMESEEINWDFSVSLPNGLSVDEVDLCAVFANSLDNAIEACEKLPAAERKLIVKAKADKGLLVLQVQNPIKVKPVKKNSLLATTKQDTNIHGFGLASIREITGRYDGSMSITAADEQFTLLIYLSMSK